MTGWIIATVWIAGVIPAWRIIYAQMRAFARDHDDFSFGSDEAFTAFCGATFWPLLLAASAIVLLLAYGYAWAFAHLVAPDRSPALEQTQAAIKRLERDLGISDER